MKIIIITIIIISITIITIIVIFIIIFILRNQDTYAFEHSFPYWVTVGSGEQKSESHHWPRLLLSYIINVMIIVNVMIIIVK